MEAKAPAEFRLRMDRGERPFDTFFDAERERLVRAMAVTLGDVHTAAEVVDEAMTRAWRRWDEVGTYDAPAGWVYHVALNLARSRWRRRRREMLRPAGELRSMADRPEQEVAPLDDGVQEALLGLSVRHREVVVLRLLLDFDVATTAAVLGVADGTVRSRLSRAVAKLRTSLETSP